MVDENEAKEPEVSAWAKFTVLIVTGETEIGGRAGQCQPGRLHMQVSPLSSEGAPSKTPFSLEPSPFMYVVLCMEYVTYN